MAFTGLSQKNAVRLEQDGAFAFLDKAELGLDKGSEALLVALARMERRGWIEEIQTAEYRRRPYALTAAGRLELARHLTLLDVIVKVGRKRIRQRGTTRRRA